MYKRELYYIIAGLFKVYKTGINKIKLINVKISEKIIKISYR